MTAVFNFQNTARGTLSTGKDGRPLFSIVDVPCLPGTLDYLATCWLDAAARGVAFHMAGGYADDPVVSINAAEVQHAAQWIRQQVPGTVGRFETSFIPNDPRVPF